jgi:UDP-sulfoquinovose synthase
VFNQFTETFSLSEIAGFVQRAGVVLGLTVAVDHIPNPRIEKEDHYYNPRHTTVLSLGLQPHYLSDEVVAGMIQRVQAARDHVDSNVIYPTIKWRQSPAAVQPT